MHLSRVYLQFWLRSWSFSFFFLCRHQPLQANVGRNWLGLLMVAWHQHIQATVADRCRLSDRQIWIRYSRHRRESEFNRLSPLRHTTVASFPRIEIVFHFSNVRYQRFASLSAKRSQFGEVFRITCSCRWSIRRNQSSTFGSLLFPSKRVIHSIFCLRNVLMLMQFISTIVQSKNSWISTIWKAIARCLTWIAWTWICCIASIKAEKFTCALTSSTASTIYASL